MEKLIYTVGKKSFYKDICGEEGLSCQNQQIIYVQNLVGGALGLDPWLNMEGNPDLVYPKLLNMTPYEVLEYFYEKQFSPTDFINKFRKYFTRLETSIWEKLKVFYCFEKKIIKEAEFTNLFEKGEISTKALIQLLEYEKVIEVKESSSRERKINYRDSSSEEEEDSF